MDDMQLIDLFFARNEAAISETASQYGNYCLTVASRILPIRQDAEEVVNDVYLTLWKAIPPNRPDNFKAFLARVTRNTALTRLQHDNRKKRGGGVVDEAIDELADLLPSESDPVAALEEKELASLISAFLRSQTKEKRKLFIRRYFYLLSIEDLTRESGLSKSNAKVTLMRMRNDLKEYLAKEGYRI